MKKIMIPLMAMLMSFSTSASAGTKTVSSTTNSFSLRSNAVPADNPGAGRGFRLEIPDRLIIKQTITFADGRQIAIFYQKEGNVCKLYSDADVRKFKESDLNRIKQTNIEITDHTEGECIMTKKTSDILALARGILGQWKNHGGILRVKN